MARFFVHLLLFVVISFELQAHPSSSIQLIQCPSHLDKTHASQVVFVTPVGQRFMAENKLMKAFLGVAVKPITVGTKKILQGQPLLRCQYKIPFVKDDGIANQYSVKQAHEVAFYYLPLRDQLKCTFQHSGPFQDTHERRCDNPQDCDVICQG